MEKDSAHLIFKIFKHFTIWKYTYIFDLHIYRNTVNFMAIGSAWLSGFKIFFNPKYKKENVYPVFNFFPTI